MRALICQVPVYSSVASDELTELSSVFFGDGKFLINIGFMQKYNHISCMISVLSCLILEGAEESEVDVFVEEFVTVFDAVLDVDVGQAEKQEGLTWLFVK